MLAQVRRFHALGRDFLARTGADDSTTFGELVESGGFTASFVELYALPLVACVWSTGTGDALGYPAHYLLRFLDHHGMLSVGGSPQWRTVVGGSASYVAKVAAHITQVRTGSPVTSVCRLPDGVAVTAGGETMHVDRAVIATHADQALDLLADPTAAEQEVLGAFRYTANETVLHRDASLLPRARLARSSWNYRVPQSDRPAAPVVTYWMNRLQGYPQADPLLVTLNGTERIDPSLILETMHYTHPVYDLAAVTAQARLPELTTSRTTFAGAYHGWGFHEDGAHSGVAAAADFGVTW